MIEHAARQTRGHNIARAALHCMQSDTETPWRIRSFGQPSRRLADASGRSRRVTDLLQGTDHELQCSSRVEVVGSPVETPHQDTARRFERCSTPLSDSDEILNHTRGGTRRCALRSFEDEIDRRRIHREPTCALRAPNASRSLALADQRGHAADRRALIDVLLAPLVEALWLQGVSTRWSRQETRPSLTRTPTSSSGPWSWLSFTSAADVES